MLVGGAFGTLLRGGAFGARTMAVTAADVALLDFARFVAGAFFDALVGGRAVAVELALAVLILTLVGRRADAVGAGD